MRLKLHPLLVSTLCLTVLASCSKQEPLPPATPTPAAALRVQPPAKPLPVPVPTEEPSAEVVERLMFEQYAELEKRGGMPVTATATGNSFTLRAKLFSARKEKCTPAPQQPAGNYECELTITLTLSSNGRAPSDRKPSEQGARIGVKWDPSGKWVEG